MAAAIIAALSACAANSVVGTRVASTGAATRSPASVAARFGLNCLAQAELFSDADSEVDFDFERASGSSVIDSDIARGIADLDAEARPPALALALAESTAYGDALVAEYDAFLERGYSLERIMNESTVYAELNALHFLKGDLLRIARRELVRSVVDNLFAASGGSRERGISVVTDASIGLLDRWKAAIRERAAGSGPDAAGYDDFVLDDVRTLVRDLVTSASALQCGGGSTPKLKLAKRPAARIDYRVFEPGSGKAGLSIASLVKTRGRALKARWRKLVSRRPQSAPAGKTFYPDAGKPGNIFGTNFPKGVWALTFDDGPHGGNKSEPSYTKAVLANLDKHRMKATFFILSQQIERADCPGIGPRTVVTRDKQGNVVSSRTVNIRSSRPSAVFPELALEERARGHSVNSHSYYHSEIPKDNDAEQNCEISRAIDVFADKMGNRPDFFRLPYGAGVSVAKVRAKIAAAKMIHVYWSVDTLDWQDHDPDSIFRRTLKGMAAAGGRGVILFHDIHPQSVLASEKVMAYLKDPANKLETVTLPEIVDRMNGVAKPAPVDGAGFGSK